MKNCGNILIRKNKWSYQMKIAILTFQFAYNYGAMLQAYALRKYLISLEHEVDVVPYYPLHLKQGYSISPFEQGLSLKHRNHYSFK